MSTTSTSAKPASCPASTRVASMAWKQLPETDPIFKYCNAGYKKRVCAMMMAPPKPEPVQSTVDSSISCKMRYAQNVRIASGTSWSNGGVAPYNIKACINVFPKYMHTNPRTNF